MPKKSEPVTRISEENGLVLGLHRQHHLEHRRLLVGFGRFHERDRILVGDLIGRPAIILVRRIGTPVVELHVMQLVALPRDRVAAHEMQHGQCGHARGNAERDAGDHERGEDRIALEAAQAQLQVVGEHCASLRRWSRRLRRRNGRRAATARRRNR
jgi:hypothetical protein